MRVRIYAQSPRGTAHTRPRVRAHARTTPTQAIHTSKRRVHHARDLPARSAIAYGCTEGRRSGKTTYEMQNAAIICAARPRVTARVHPLGRRALCSTCNPAQSGEEWSGVRERFSPVTVKERRERARARADGEMDTDGCLDLDIYIFIYVHICRYLDTTHMRTWISARNLVLRPLTLDPIASASCRKALVP